MVAAATALCLESTNVHHVSTKQTAAFASLAGALVVDCQQKMSLNFGNLLNSSPPMSADASKSTNMDSLLVSNLSAIPQISPGMAAMRKINEVLAHSSSSGTASPTTPFNQQNSADENSPGASNETSVHMAEQFKDALMKAIDNNNFDEVARLIDEIEAAHLSKNALEISRIGAVVNTLRRNIANTHPELARKCRSLIKSWRSNVEALVCSSRPSSSCGSSSGTPALVSPAIRSKITPRGKTITPTSQLAFEGFSANASYAPDDKTSPQLSSTKRKAVISPNLILNKGMPVKKLKLSPTPPISVIEARRNVQSTDSLLAAMGMEKFLTNTVEKRSEEVAQTNGITESIAIPSIQTQEKRGRKKREPKVETPIVPRLKIFFGGKSAEEHISNETTSVLPDAIPSTSKHRSNKKSNKKKRESSKPAFSWYDKLPTIDELDSRSQKPSEIVTESSTTPTDPTISKYRERKIVLMPYLEADEPDFLLYDYPNKERFVAQKRPF